MAVEQQTKATADAAKATNVLDIPLREPIALVGLSARFPQEASNPQGFWEMIKEGRVANTAIPRERVNIDAYYHPNPERTSTVESNSSNRRSSANDRRAMSGLVTFSLAICLHSMLLSSQSSPPRPNH